MFNILHYLTILSLGPVKTICKQKKYAVLDKSDSSSVIIILGICLVMYRILCKY
ncbi:MAG: hypothetical protein HPY66_2476 [Firmicutes bacterium]|nr:hypothetical protein [Bacillota bacterium]